MRKRFFLIIICVSCLGMAAADNCKQQLLRLFDEAEHCYLIDDYQQLWLCITQYYDVLSRNKEQLGTSRPVYEAFYNKMCGSYYYGFAGDNSYAADYAEERYLKSLSVFSQRNSTKYVMTIHEELAQLYYKTGKYDDALERLEMVLQYYEKQCFELEIESAEPKYYQVLSQIAICNARLDLFEEALQQIDEALKYYKKGKTSEYYETLRKKAKILMLQADALGEGDYRVARRCYEQYVNERCQSIGQQLAVMNESQREQYWLATHRFLYDCCRLGAHAPEMLYNLTLFSKGYLLAYEHNKSTGQTKWKQVRKSLGKKDCAIEFVQYFGKDDEKRLGCLLLSKSSKKPVFIDLLSSDSLLSLPLTLDETIGSAIESPSGEIKNKLYNDSRLPHLIWTPQLMNAIGDAENIFFAPDGFLHLLAIEYLMPDSQKVCYRLSSTRKLTEKRQTPKLESALLCGGIDYEADYHPTLYGNDTIAYRSLSPQTSSITYLPYTKDEVDSVFQCRNNPKDTLLTGSEATDETLIKLINNHYDVVHISTHGFYGGRTGVYNDIKPLFNDESMSKSGILLAGSSVTLADIYFDDNLYDGVFSAKEMSKQDFSQTELVVLSACQTGKGHLTEDGIYGVQRGLKQAGAQSMIVSLWNVYDEASSFFITQFYKNLEAGQMIREAFWNARKSMIDYEQYYGKDSQPVHGAAVSFMDRLRNRRIVKKYDSPCFYDAFILID